MEFISTNIGRVFLVSLIIFAFCWRTQLVKKYRNEFLIGFSFLYIAYNYFYRAFFHWQEVNKYDFGIYRSFAKYGEQVWFDYKPNVSIVWFWSNWFTFDVAYIIWYVICSISVFFLVSLGRDIGGGCGIGCGVLGPIVV